LVQDLNAILNSANISQTQVQAIASDAQAILQVGSAKRSDAVNVASDLKAVALEVQTGR
jgi:hypothetical protein